MLTMRIMMMTINRMDPKPWKKISEEVKGDFRIFKIRDIVYESPRTGKEHRFYRLEGNDWINVIPITEDNEVVMVKQYRMGTETVELEVPGGILENNEKPEEAAIRELEEETGYRGVTSRYLGAVKPNPAIQDNLCHTVLVEGVKRVSEQNLDPGEDIVVELVPYSKISELIENGTIRHSLVICAFHLLKQNIKDY